MRFSKIIAEKYKVSGRDNLQRIGLEIANDIVKQKELSDIMISEMKETENYVLDGIRHVIDYNNLASSLGDRFVLIHIHAEFNTREKRYRKSESNISAEKFKTIDNHPVEKSVAKIISKRNYKINNNKGYNELTNRMDLFLTKFNK
jgi:hypothetical protein